MSRWDPASITSWVCRVGRRWSSIPASFKSTFSYPVGVREEWVMWGRLGDGKCRVIVHIQSVGLDVLFCFLLVIMQSHQSELGGWYGGGASDTLCLPAIWAAFTCWIISTARDSIITFNIAWPKSMAPPDLKCSLNLASPGHHKLGGGVDRYLQQVLYPFLKEI